MVSPPRRDSVADRWLSAISKVALALSTPILGFMLKVGWDLRVEAIETRTTVAVLKDRSDRESEKFSSIRSQIEDVTRYTSEMRSKTKQRDYEFTQIRAQISDIARRLPSNQ